MTVAGIPNSVFPRRQSDELAEGLSQLHFCPSVRRYGPACHSHQGYDGSGWVDAARAGAGK